MEQTRSVGTVAVEVTLAVLGGKWKLLILWHLRPYFVYYSYVTLTTVGYGDILPKTL